LRSLYKIDAAGRLILCEPNASALRPSVPTTGPDERQACEEKDYTGHQEHHVPDQMVPVLHDVMDLEYFDCLWSDVRLNVDFDLTLSVLADLLYRGLAERLKGFAHAGPSELFRKFVDTPGSIEIPAQGVIVRLSKRAHNPLLKEAGLTQPTRAIPWLGGRCVRLECP